ncbi:hypothetical protein [Cryobacterium aureum]|uniref:hypothetical protein n=1 Tax=Cryobacterium aureum TaxID=995037 RepID=UPI00101ADF13|nr:hypothetical protein [Cryobacterium aureum]
MTALVLLAAGTLSGCSATPAPPPSDTPKPVAAATAAPAAATATPPVFASNDEALAAATAFYASYQGTANTISHDGGVDPQRITPFVTTEMLPGEIASFKRLTEKGVHLVGDLAFDSMTIQSANLKNGSVVVYMCLDVSATDIVDAAGISIVPADRISRHPLQVALTQDSTANRLVLERSELWTGKNFC